MGVDTFFPFKSQFAICVQNQEIADFGAGPIRPHSVSGVIAESRAHFLRRAEKTVFGGFFSRAEGFANRTKPQPLIVPHFKNHPFPGSAIGNGPLNAGAQFSGQEPALGIVFGPLLGA